jgi:hypothetical protein
VSFRLDGRGLPALLPADAGAYRDAVLKTAGTARWRCPSPLATEPVTAGTGRFIDRFGAVPG